MFRDQIVKLLCNDNEEPYENPKWCYAIMLDGSFRTLCSGEVYNGGEGRAVGKVKVVNKQKITCKICKEIIDTIKRVKT